MQNENKELYDKYVKDALESAKVVTLGLPKAINEKLDKLNLITVSDLSLIESKTNERINEVLLEEEIQLVICKRDKYISNIEHMIDISIDPENCNIGTINKYYELLLAIEKYEEKYCNPLYNKIKVCIRTLEENSIIISRINLMLISFNEKDIKWLELRYCDRLTFNEIGLLYGVNSTICRTRVMFLMRRLYNFYNAFVIDSSKIVVSNEEYLQSNECSIYFLGFDEKICNSLIRKKIFTKEELKSAISNNEVMKIRNIGKKSYNLILKALAV